MVMNPRARYGHRGMGTLGQREQASAGYHLLESAPGTEAGRTSTRCSPATRLARWRNCPRRRSAGWSDKEQPSYLGIAIHDAAERVQYESSGREIVLTSYFCVPFNELAAGSVSYHAMYQKFRRCGLPVSDRHRIQARLAGELGEAADAFAMRVAALLLTSKPVCIIGADCADVGIDERLRFLDRVMSLLPYGMLKPAVRLDVGEQHLPGPPATSLLRQRAPTGKRPCGGLEPASP